MVSLGWIFVAETWIFLLSSTSAGSDFSPLDAWTSRMLMSLMSLRSLRTRKKKKKTYFSLSLFLLTYFSF